MVNKLIVHPERRRAADALFEAHNLINKAISAAAFAIIEGADADEMYARVTREVLKALADATAEITTKGEL